MSDLVDELGPSDYFYNPEQETFLVVMDKNDDEITFAVHGWRVIEADRLEEYLSGNEIQHVVTRDELREKLSESSSDVGLERLDTIENIFDIYKDRKVKGT